MKSSNSRSENAKNEARDSQGRFTSEHKGNQSGSSKSSSKSTDHRGENAKNEPRDSQGRFTSEKSSSKK